MTVLIVNDKKYKIHPKFNLYAASKDGDIIHILKQKPNKGKKSNNGYLMISVRQFGQSGQKFCTVHKFVYECYYGVIANNGMQVDHINDLREDNRLCNLQLLTPSANAKKACKNRKHFNNHENRKCVKATNEVTREVLYYFSISSTAKHLQINRASVMRVCEGVIKSTKSKKDNCSYKFEYVDQNLKVEFIKTRLRKTLEQIKERNRRWQNKDWKCPNCDKVYRNHYKYRHRKICK